MKTHWKKLINPDYIGAYYLEDGKDLTVEITEVKREFVSGEGGRKEECTVAYLKGHKPFILNRTNQKMISLVLKSPYIEDWIGKKITLYVTTTKMKGDTVECLRVREKAPTPNEADDATINKIISALEKAKNNEELINLYNIAEKKYKLTENQVKLLNSKINEISGKF